VLGPLPRLYRAIVAAAAVVVFVTGGAWAAFVLPYPILISVGASVGLAAGAICAYLLLHQDQHTTVGQRARRPRSR
jgi:Na+/H+ antiporter NhaC